MYKNVRILCKKFKNLYKNVSWTKENHYFGFFFFTKSAWGLSFLGKTKQFDIL